MEWTALGIFFSGSSLSPAAMPIISVPWKEKPATMKIPRTAAPPPTKGASPTVQFVKPGASPPTPRMSKVPTTRKVTTVITLILEKINSLSP